MSPFCLLVLVVLVQADSSHTSSHVNSFSRVKPGQKEHSVTPPCLALKKALHWNTSPLEPKALDSPYHILSLWILTLWTLDPKPDSHTETPLHSETRSKHESTPRAPLVRRAPSRLGSGAACAAPPVEANGGEAGPGTEAPWPQPSGQAVSPRECKRNLSWFSQSRSFSNMLL